MINPVELFVGLRYLRAKRRTRFVSFITLISMAGIAVGVAALIVILSVMNGFESELRNRLLSMTAHGSIASTDGVTDDWQDVLSTLEETPGVQAAAPFSELEGMIQADGELFAVLVHGIDPEFEVSLSGDAFNLVEGSLDVLQPGERSIILGQSLAYELRARLGDSVLLLVPTPVGDGTLQPVLERFVLRGVFAAGLADHDSILALVHRGDVADILQIDEGVAAVRFRSDDVFAAPAISKDVAAQLGESYLGSDWTIENGSYFRAIRLER